MGKEMGRWILAFVVITTTRAVGLAEGYHGVGGNGATSIYNTGLGCSECFNFTAPLVFGAGNVNPAEVGQIIYDTEDDEFKGYKSDGSWAKLSNREVESPSFLAQTSSIFSSVTNGTYLQMTGNSVTLTPGSWRVSGRVDFLGSPGYTQIGMYWKSANGNNTSSTPPATVIEAGSTFWDRIFTSRPEYKGSMTDIRVTVSVNTPVYLVPVVWGSASPSSATVKTYIYAEKIR